MGRCLLITCIAVFAGQERLASGQELKTRAREQVDALVAKVQAATQQLKPVVVIDHDRLAAKEGVEMPAAIVTIASDPAVQTRLIALQPRLGLDLPFKFLAFWEPANRQVQLAFAEDGYLARRHGVRPEQLEEYQKHLQEILAELPDTNLSPVSNSELSQDYGLVELESDFGFDETIKRLKSAILKQGDTVWFGEVDYCQDARQLGVALPRNTLLLFGGPKPGGVAMAKFPKLGLDAFCQKLLVYETADEKVHVLFNDIAAFARLHYGQDAPVHQALNKRLTTTFEGAIHGQP